MTKRDFYTAIVNGESNEDIVKYAQELLTKLDSTNVANRTKRAEKSATANDPIKASIVDYLKSHNEPVVASEVGKALDITTSKASALLRQIEGLVVTEVKSGKGKVKGYALPEA